jgi:hypothetical protein
MGAPVIYAWVQAQQAVQVGMGRVVVVEVHHAVHGFRSYAHLLWTVMVITSRPYRSS